MAARTYTEGVVQFSFSPEWLVRKYDDHTFYRGLSGVGLKGVDFIAVRPGQLVLIEVKNYRHVRNGQRRRVVGETIRQSERIADAIAQKCLDTLRAIRVIHTYYLRKWDYRLTSPLFGRFHWQWSDRSFWTHVAQALSGPAQVTLLVWLATDPGDQSLAHQLLPIIRKELDDQVGRVLITDEKHQPLPGIRVKWPEELV